MTENRLTVFLIFIQLALLHIHVWACVFYLLASADVDAQVSWTKGRENFFQLELWSRYITSVYFVTTIYSTVGFGDFHPTTDMEMIVCLVYMALNMGFGAGLFDQFISLVVKLIRPADKDVSNIFTNLACGGRWVKFFIVFISSLSYYLFYHADFTFKCKFSVHQRLREEESVLAISVGWIPREKVHTCF